jgi:hypothetical protein
MMPAFRTNMVRDVSEVWREGDWSCELHCAAGGQARLKIFRGEKLEVIEPTCVGDPAYARAEILRQLLCGEPNPPQDRTVSRKVTE